MCQKNTLHETYKAEFFSTDFNELHTNFRQYTVKSTVSYFKIQGLKIGINRQPHVIK